MEEQLFNLYHSEKRIQVTTDQIKEKQKELDKQVTIYSVLACPQGHKLDKY